MFTYLKWKTPKLLGCHRFTRLHYSPFSVWTYLGNFPFDRETLVHRGPRRILVTGGHCVHPWRSSGIHCRRLCHRGHWFIFDRTRIIAAKAHRPRVNSITSIPRDDGGRQRPVPFPSTDRCRRLGDTSADSRIPNERDDFSTRIARITVYCTNAVRRSG